MPVDVDLPLLLVIAGVVLMVLEALAPGAHFIVLGVALLAAGLVGMALAQVGILPASLLLLVLSALVFLFGAVALYIYREFEFYTGTEAGRTTDSSSLRGRSGRVVEQVTPTEGRVKLDQGGFNPYYQARSMDGEIPEGEEVFVIDPGGGNVLTVESLSGIEGDEIDRELERGRRKASDDDSLSESDDEPPSGNDDPTDGSDGDPTREVEENASGRAGDDDPDDEKDSAGTDVETERA